MICGGLCIPRADLYGKPQLRRELYEPMHAPMYGRMLAVFGSGHAAMHRSMIFAFCGGGSTGRGVQF